MLLSVDYTEIPLHIVGDSILPLRAQSSMTTKALRQQPFNFVIAPGTNGKASGSLYIDDGVTISPPQHSTTTATLSYSKNKFTVSGHFGFSPAPQVASVTLLGAQKTPRKVEIAGSRAHVGAVAFNSTSQSLVISLNGLKLDHAFEVDLTF